MPAKNSSRIARVEQEIQVQLSKLIAREIKDPRLGIVTITGVQVARDFAHAKIFIVLRDESQAEINLAILNKASGFLRRALGRELNLRVVPELHFHYDSSSTYGRRIDEILRNVNVKDDESEKE